MLANDVDLTAEMLDFGLTKQIYDLLPWMDKISLLDMATRLSHQI